MGKKTTGKKPTLIFLVFFAALITLGLALEMKTSLISDAFNGGKRQLVPKGIRYEYGSDSSVCFSKGSNGFLCATEDSATYYSFKGEVIWSQTYSMNNPYIIQDGDTWAILEPSGRNVYVVTNKKVLYHISSEYTVLNASINNLSCLLLIVQVGDSYKIQLFNPQGENAIDRESELEGIYPICGDISDDGSIYAISYLDTTGFSMLSRIMLFYSDVGAKKYAKDAQTAFFAIEKRNSLVVDLSFSSDNRLMAVSDESIYFFDENGEGVNNIELGNRLTSFSYGENIFGLTLGQALINSEETLEVDTALWFDYNGKNLKLYHEEDYENIELTEDFIVLKGRERFVCLDKNGKELWSYAGAKDIDRIIPIDKSRALIVRKSYAEIYANEVPKNMEAPE